MRWAAGGFYTQADSYLRLPFRGGGTALAVTEGLSVEARQKLPQSYGQLPRREPKRRRQFNAAPMCKFRRANTVRPHRDNSTVQLFYGTSRTPSPTICADNLRLLKPPSDEGGGAALAVTEGEKREANKSCRKFGVASACIV